MRAAAVALVLVPAVAYAEDKRCIDVQFTPSSSDLQIVAWVADANDAYVGTVFITQATGTFGLGNRPGRFDLNSGPGWPYGRRITTFPVWAHANGQQFPYVLFQGDYMPKQNPTDPDVPFEDPDFCFTVAPADYLLCGENYISRAFNDSSREGHYCRPILPTETLWDAGTCATTVFSDKGRFSRDPSKTTGYPPRTDLVRQVPDSPSVDMFRAMNPFDAVSQATPLAGVDAHAPWPVPATLPNGTYVLYVEVSKERDYNATFTTAAYPSPANIGFAEYGQAFRGQPSIVYRVPFTIAATATSAETTDYFGHGDPDGATGTITPAGAGDGITTGTPGTGASRLEIAHGYRLRVTVDPNSNAIVPGAPTELQATDVTGSTVMLSFVAPGIGTPAKAVTGYEIRVRANDPMTADNFADSMPVTTRVVPVAPGAAQPFELKGLLPETDYWIGVRAFDGCANTGDLAIVKVTTAQRVGAAVDACFVATAAYGSVMANDVEVLRHFRDAMLASNVIGELGVETYYTFGPALASVVGESDLLRVTARDALRPIIERVRRLAY